MDNNIDKQLDTNISNSINGLINSFNNLNLSADEIYEHIKTLGESVRAHIHIVALRLGNKELAQKISMANEKIKKERINNFVDSIINGTKDEFLENMSWTDKSSLRVDIEHYKDSEPLKLDVKTCTKIIDESIYYDLTKIAKTERFDSVEAWQKNNTLKVPHKPFHAGRPRENIIRSAPFTNGTIHRKK